MAEKKRVNIWEIPVAEIKKGVCRFCGDGVYYHMEPGIMIEDRAYDYAMKYSLTVRGTCPTFSASITREMLVIWITSLKMSYYGFAITVVIGLSR